MAPAVFLFPLLLWIGSRCRPVFAAAAAFSVAAAIVWTTIHGVGRYGDPNPAIADRVLAAQVTMLGITLAALAVAPLFAERRKAVLALAEARGSTGTRRESSPRRQLRDRHSYRNGAQLAGLRSHPWPAGGNEEFPREQWRARVHPDDLPRLDALRSQAFAERRREHKTEYRLPSADGSVQWIESRGLITYDDDGCPTRLVGVNINMTERKRPQAALEESEARYRALYDDNPSMYFTVDASGTVLSVNEFGARQLGYTPAELVGQSVLEMIYEGDREQARRWLASCAENAARSPELRCARFAGTGTSYG